LTQIRLSVFSSKTKKIEGSLDDLGFPQRLSNSMLVNWCFAERCQSSAEQSDFLFAVGFVFPRLADWR
jgi:hypothetical protein